MDPRKAAKVTSPDLARAFREGSGGAGERADSPNPLKLYVVLGHQDVGVIEAGVFELVEMDIVLDRVRVHLEEGYKQTVAMAVAVDPPKWYAERTDGHAVSQIEH